jgi:uncharacterized protein YbcI
MALEFTAGAPSPHTAISNALVRLLAEYTGRGATQVRTFIDADLVATLFGDALTKAERTLVAAGQADAVLDMRRRVQDIMRPQAVALVEQATGRKVLAFLSDNHIDPDFAIEAFVLEPEPNVPLLDAARSGESPQDATV